MAESAWKPLDIMAGGILTAGIAIGVYKLGRGSYLSLRGDHEDKLVSQGDQLFQQARFQESESLARLPGSELEVHFPPKQSPKTKQLADSLRRSMETQNGTSTSQPQKVQEDVSICQHGHLCGLEYGDVQPTHFLESAVDAEIKEELISPVLYEDRPRHRRRRFSQHSTIIFDLETSPPDHTKQLKAYQQRLDKLSAESDMKLEMFELQRLELSRELNMTREMLADLRRDKEAAVKDRHLAEAQLKELESRLKRAEALEAESAAKTARIQQLEKNLSELEEQLETMYQLNVLTPREAAHQQWEDFEQVKQHLDSTLAQLTERERDFEEIENENTSLHSDLKKTRKCLRELGEDNASLQKQLLKVRDFLRDVASRLCAILRMFTDEQGKDSTYISELSEIPNADLQLEDMMQRVQTVFRQGIIDAFIESHRRGIH